MLTSSLWVGLEDKGVMYDNGMTKKRKKRSNKRIFYKAYSFRMKEETYRKLQEEYKKRGGSWNRFFNLLLKNYVADE